MPRGINNWVYNDVATFLKENGFYLNHVKGSHYFFVGYINKVYRQVCVPYYGKLSIKPRTMKGIITQSGIPREDWTGRKK